MTKLRLYWEFYKSTLTMNLSFSIASAALIFPAFFKVFTICFMTVGLFISFFYKELAKKNEYYFYHNKGISKIALIIVSVGISLVIGIVLLNLESDVKPLGN